jgi:DNA polymerase III delta subunit
VFHADTADPGAVVEAGEALPLFAGPRLVVVRGLAEAPARVVDRLGAALEGAGRAEGRWPAAGTTVALVAAGADRRAPALRLLDEAARVEVRPPPARALGGWLRDRARAAGVTLTPEAARLLVEQAGDGAGRLLGELDKAALLVGPGGRVDEAAVRALAGAGASPRYWELTAALEEGRRADALRLLEALLAEGDDPLVALAWLSGHVATLARVAAGLAAGLDTRGLGQALKTRRPDFAVERLAVRARGLGEAGIARAAARCYQVERRLKASGGSPRALLTALVADLAR